MLAGMLVVLVAVDTFLSGYMIASLRKYRQEQREHMRDLDSMRIYLAAKGDTEKQDG